MSIIAKRWKEHFDRQMEAMAVAAHEADPKLSLDDAREFARIVFMAQLNSEIEWWNENVAGNPIPVTLDAGSIGR